ncbi:hypothetical protein SAMN04487848_0323 [Microbacterium sp. ru370.1]|uniref:hypothetical protein n=1 Tax=unclassified Microbacterium TaxID=2609290 RepID=UPI00088001D2|nr:MULTISPECIES: hypothetical protein [unclassified Microbacterium]SDO31097.1 hypothetical protein SAMN04487848_0323 [Microbacterium sp. ru370.1]SIT76271.1 hypothetical protein SAMN05880579_0318 [Microbacterium sp. RU1D]
MTTSTPLDARSLAHRLTTVGHALHHRLFAQLRDSGIHPKTVLLLSAVDGRVDAPWVSARLARGGKRIDSLVTRGWIGRGDEGWALTDEGRAVLDRVDAARAALLADVPADELERLTTALDAVSAAIGVDETDDEGSRTDSPEGLGAGRDFGPFGRGFGPGMRGFGPRAHGFGPRKHGFGPQKHGVARGEHGEHGFGPGGRDGHDSARGAHGERGGHGLARGERGLHGSSRGEAGHGAHGHDEHDRAGHGRGCDPRRDGSAHGREHHHGHRRDDGRWAQRAYERGFDAGFSRGREASASGDAPASA